MTSIDSISPAFEELFVDPRSLPSPSTSVLQLLRRADDPDVEMAEIAHLIESDVSLAVQVLRMANSALYSPSREITTVARALTTLGLRTIKLLALTTSLRSLIPQQHDVVDVNGLRYRMVVTAGLAKRTAKLIAPVDQEEAQISGLLTGIGPLVLATAAPEAARAVVGSSPTWPRPERELEVLGFTTDDISSELVRQWGLPELFVEALRGRRSPVTVPEADVTVGVEDCLRLATLAEPILTGSGLAHDVAGTRLALSQLADLDESEADQWLIEADTVVADTAELVQFRIPHDVAYSELLAEAADRIISLQEMLDAQLFHAEESVDELAKRNDQLEVEASTDALTKLPNRRAFDREVASLMGSPAPDFGLLLIDLDRFKSVNDSFGHSVGDDVLRLVGSTLRHQTRGDDFAARYGGEEFAMLVPAATPEILRSIGDRLRAAIAKLVVTVPDGPPLSVTASVGGALLDPAGDRRSARVLIEAADAQLYLAKTNGRNQTCIG